VVAAMKQYLALVKHRRGFVIGLLLVLAVATLCEVIGYTTWIGGPGGSDSRQLAVGFGDAFIIAFVIALLADPVAQRKFATDWGREIFWAIFNRDAPEEFRKALQRLAEPRVFVRHCIYELEFTQHDSEDATNYVMLNWRILLKGKVLDRHGFLPEGTVFVVSGHDGRPSDYIEWVFDASDSRVAYNLEQMRKRGAVRVEEDGRTALDQDTLARGVSAAPYQSEYRAERRLITTRHRTDYVPLFQPQMVISQDVIVTGPAVGELVFSAVQLGFGPLECAAGEDPDDPTELRFSTANVAFPGQAILLAWRPKKDTDATAHDQIQVPRIGT
jgi:uncharacterized membrane protein (DUF485 family)